MEIHRAAGMDKEGILYIGRSDILRERIKDFWGTINGNVKPHSGAKTYYYNFDKYFPKERLEVRWALIKESEEAEDAEKQLLNGYLIRNHSESPINKRVLRRG